jgi:GT2 family glycosyltransferase
LRLSIVIPSFSRTDLLALCLESLQQHAPAGTDILVADDASVGHAVSATARRFSGVRVLRLPRRGGFCTAVNAGIKAAAGDVIELLNDDTEVTAGWANAALRWFDDPHVGAVAPLVLCSPEGNTIDSAGDRYFAGGVAAKRGRGQPLSQAPLEAMPVFGASGSSAFYRRQALERIGGFPAFFRAYFEDVDVAFRFQRAGYQTIFEPSAQVYHRVSSSHGRPDRRLLEQQSCNEERVFWRNLPSGELLRVLPMHAAVLAGKAMRRWREGTLTPWLCGRLRLLGEIPELLQQRGQIARLGPAKRLEEWNVERRYWG